MRMYRIRVIALRLHVAGEVGYGKDILSSWAGRRTYFCFRSAVYGCAGYPTGVFPCLGRLMNLFRKFFTC
jgi:hypothetical protein